MQFHSRRFGWVIFGDLDRLATQSKTQKKWKFPEIETRGKTKVNQIFSFFNHRRFRKEAVLEFEDDCIQKEEEEQYVSTQFSKTHKNPLIDLQDHLEIYQNVHPVFGFNSAKYDNELIVFLAASPR